MADAPTPGLDAATRDALYGEMRAALRQFEDTSCPPELRRTSWAVAASALAQLDDERSIADVLRVAQTAVDRGDEERAILVLSAIASRLPRDCAPLLRLGDRACSRGLLEVVTAVGRELRRRNLCVPADWTNVLMEDRSRDWAVTELVDAPGAENCESVAEPSDPDAEIVPAHHPQASAEGFADEPAEPFATVLAHPIKTVLHEAFDCIAKANARGARITGTPTGFDAYDRLTGGLHDGELTVIAARPGVGKTSFVLNLAANVASAQELVSAHDPAERWVEPGQGVLVFSPGDSRRQTVSRMLCAEARIDTGKVRAGMLAKRDWEQLTLAAGHLAVRPIWVNDTPDLSPFDIRTVAARLGADYDRFDPAGKRTHRLGLVVIDGCHRVRGGRKALRRLRDIARELMVPIIATTALDPVPDDRDGGKRPHLSDLPLSDDDADNICFIHRDAYYDRDAEQDVVELIVASGRIGLTIAPGKKDDAWGRDLETDLDRLRESFGASVLVSLLGDALGYPVEFLRTAAEIERVLGPAFPERLPRSPGGKAIISDDTQMTLFTAEGLIRAQHRLMDRGESAHPVVILGAYQRWLSTQTEEGLDRWKDPLQRGWLLDVPELGASRAPGNTCLSALMASLETEAVPSTHAPPNDSKGCGAVMRSAPIGLVARDIEAAFRLGRDAAVLTHGHPSGYLSAAYFAALVHQLVRDASLVDAMRAADELLRREPDTDEVRAAIDAAREAAAGGEPSREAIERLGGGWVGVTTSVPWGSGTARESKQVHVSQTTSTGSPWQGERDAMAPASANPAFSCTPEAQWCRGAVPWWGMTPESVRLRRSAGYAAARFEGLCGPANVGPCAELLASAVERCATVGGGWAITLDSDIVKLNAGPVRVLYIADNDVWFVTTEEAGRVPSWLEEERQKKNGVRYPAVPVRTRAFTAPTSKLRGLPKPVRAAFLSYVEEAVRRRRGPSLFIKAHSPSVLALLNQLLGRRLPPPPGASEPEDDDAEDLSTAEHYVEGRRVTLVLDAHERDPRARAACIQAHGARCTACGMSFEEAYGPLGEGFIEVHHLHRLADARGPRKLDPTLDLVPVCPNCHRMLHRKTPPLTPAELAALSTASRRPAR